jgi:hypothetical protein
MALGAGAASFYFGGFRSQMFSSFSITDVEGAVFVFGIPSVCSALGAVAAGYMAGTRAIRAPAVAAILVAGILSFVAMRGGAGGSGGLISAMVLVCVANALSSALLVFAAITLVQGIGSGLAIALGLVLSAQPAIYLLRDVMEIDLYELPVFFTIFGACAGGAFLWGPSVSPVYRRQMAYAPVGPAPISMRGEPSRTPVLMLLVAAAAVASTSSFLTAGRFSENEVYSFQSYILLAPLAVGVAVSMVGEAGALRLIVLAGLAGFAWLGFGEGELYPAAVAVYFAGGAFGAVADFASVLLGSRYGQPGEATRRIGVLIGAQSIAYAGFNLWVTISEDGRPDDPFAIVLIGIGASVLALLLLFQLPRFRSPAAAW